MVKIPGFEIKKQLYQCETYVVFRGIQEKDNQLVILKMQRGEYLSTELYQHEYDILRNLDGDGVVNALDLITHQEVSVIIYEDVGAESLDILMEDTAVSMADRLTLAIGITTALDQVHQAGYLHKSINPFNILYRAETGQVQLINFELAIELISDQMHSDGSEVTPKTMAYIAPEQTGRMKRPLDYRSDLYSLGVTLYQLFSGKIPFDSDDPLELIHSHIAKIPVSLHEANPLVSRVLSDIIMKLMAKEATQRYQGTAGLKHDLEVCLDQFKKTGSIHPFTLQEHDISDQFSISGKLYGREEEISTLMAAFARAEKGGREQVLVTGYAGIGKTALVREVLQQCISDNAQVMLLFGIGRFDRFHRDIPYNAIVQASKDVIRQILAKSDSELKIWREKLAKALGRNGHVIADIIPEIEIILGPQPSVPKLGPLKARNRLHLVFQNFVRALSGPSHPLVIFVDDLQWADEASLKLIETILIDKGLHYFLGITALRDNEIAADHSINNTLDTLKNQGVRMTWIRLATLGLESVKSLIADSIRTDKKRISELGALTLQKTDGNPFFTEMFLKTLHREQLLFFNRDRNQWQWSVSRINELEITDNVVDLLVQKIDRLSENTRELLKWASCIGLEFELAVFSAVSGQTSIKIDTDLREAVIEGIVVPVDHVHKQTKGRVGTSQRSSCAGYRFVHSRIRQMIYASMPENEKHSYHAQLGNYLLGSLTDSEKEEQLFAIVNHLNVGSSKETAVFKGDKLAQLNLDAGLKAKTAAAFHPALNYFRHGILMLKDNHWEDSYDLALNLYEEAAETAYLSDSYSEMDRLAEQVLQCAHSLLDKVNIYETIINSSIARYQLEEAISTAIDVLRKLNVHLPSKASRWKLFRGFMSAKSTLVWKNVEDLAKMEKMTDPNILAVMQVLKSAGAAAYFSNQELLAVMTFKAVPLSTRYGNAPESAIWYAAYGLILCGVMGDIDTGYQFGQLSLKLLKQYNLPELTPQAGQMVNAFIRHWKIHIRETLTPLKDAYLSGLETGDFEYAGYSALFFCYYSFVAGIESMPLT